MNRKLITGWLLLVLGLAQAGGGVLLARAAAAQEAQLADPNLVRIHVIAHSDAPEEQALKLAVRDAVLDLLRPAVSGARSRAEAEARIRAVLPELERSARAVVAAWGMDHPVRAELGTYAFPGKGYDGLYLPAGRYRALRILIGDAAGANFWCLVYPSFCYTIREVRAPAVAAAAPAPPAASPASAEPGAPAAPAAVSAPAAPAAPAERAVAGGPAACACECPQAGGCQELTLGGHPQARSAADAGAGPVKCPQAGSGAPCPDRCREGAPGECAGPAAGGNARPERRPPPADQMAGPPSGVGPSPL